MLGNPKYKIGDIVEFVCGDNVKQGIIEIVDRWGTYFDKSDVSYDIMVDSDNTLYKHFNESDVIKKIE